jgi:hypothetical protein
MVKTMPLSVFLNGLSLANILWSIRKFATESPRSGAPALWSGRCWMTWRKADLGNLSAACDGAAGFPLRPWVKRSSFRGNHGWTSAADCRACHSLNGPHSLPLESAGRELSGRPAVLASRVADSFPGNWPPCGSFRCQRREHSPLIASATAGRFFHAGRGLFSP